MCRTRATRARRRRKRNAHHIADKRLSESVGAAAGLAIRPAFGQVPPLKKKDTYKVGFAQTESNNPWRLAQTASMKDEAAKRGGQLVYTDAAGSAAKQVADVNSMIAQGVDFIFLPPREEKPLIPAVMAAKKAGIPVLADRPQRRSVARQAGRRLPRLHRLELRLGRPARRGLDDQDRPAARARSSNSRARSAPRPPTTARRASTRRSRPRRPDMEIRRQPVRRLRPRQGPPGRRDAVAGASGRDHRLRAQRRNGARRHRRDRGRRQGSRQGHPRRLDRRREGRIAGDHRRQAGLRRASAIRASDRRRSTFSTTTRTARRSRRSSSTPTTSTTRATPRRRCRTRTEIANSDSPAEAPSRLLGLPAGGRVLGRCAVWHGRSRKCR